MASYNKVVLMGNLTRDIEIKTLDNGTVVGEFGLAVNESYTDKRTGEKVDTPVYVDVTVWGKQAEVCSQYISKGSGAMVDGKLKLDVWQGDDGNNRQKLRVVANQVVFVGGKSNPADADVNQDPGDDYLDSEEIPF